MGGEEDGFAAGGEGADLGPEGAAGLDVHADGGLVEEDDVGVAGEGEGEEGALLLAAGEIAELLVHDAVEAGDADELGDGHGRGIVAAEEVDVLADVEHLGGVADLEHGSDAGAGGGVAGVSAEDAGAAGGGGGEAEQEADGGGLAGAVRAEQGDDLAGVEGEAEAVEGCSRRCSAW